MVSRFSRFPIAATLIAVAIPFLFQPHPSAADSFLGTIVTGTDRNAWYDASVATVNPSHDYTPIFDEARTKWNAVYANGKVKIGKVTSTATKPDKYYVTASDANLGRLGTTKYYRSTAAGTIVVSADDDYTYSTVAIVDGNITDGGYTDFGRVYAAVHEIGHSLKLAHAGSDGTFHTAPVPAGERSIMAALIPAPEFTVENSPTSYDISELMYKWGP